jgi:MoaA/NifB/PqqE/SkfB family radical SAM enzyme
MANDTTMTQSAWYHLFRLLHKFVAIGKEGRPMARLKKAYLEITNVCNLACSFCPKTRRATGFLSPEEFQTLAGRLRPYTDHLYFHLMGEPLLHPRLDELLTLADGLGFRVMLTTNGTLLGRWREVLPAAPALEKVSISLHCLEANQCGLALDDYLALCLDMAQALSRVGKKCGLRLWNLDGAGTVGENRDNDRILAALEERFHKPWQEGRRGTRLAEGVYLEWGERFDWPDLNAPEGGQSGFCYGLRDQVGVLWDGTVVPCCLDHEGDIPLGNLFRQELGEILDGPRARAIYDGFSRRQAVEELCRKCGYARRFQ